MRYSHTQKGMSWIALTSLMIAVGVTLIASTQLAVRDGPVMFWPFALVALIGVAVVLIFSRLTAEVDDTELRWAFGRGFPRYRLALDRIESTSVVTNSVWLGFGIRIYPGGMLYNIAGNRAVEITRRGGGKIRIGTDEPEALRAAIEEARR